MKPLRNRYWSVLIDRARGLRDTFNSDFKDCGSYPFGSKANIGVALIRSDAWLCGHGDVSIPISGGVQ